MVKHEPEIRRAKARLYVTWCNVAVHKAPWTTGRTRSPNGGGIYQALELAEQALRGRTVKDARLSTPPVQMDLRRDRQSRRLCESARHHHRTVGNLAALVRLTKR